MRYIYIFLWAWLRTWKYICEKERIEFTSAKCWYNIVQHIFDLSLTHILPKTSVQCVIVAHERVSAREKPTQSWWECRAANSVKLCSPWKSSSSDRRWKILFKVFLRYLLATLAHRVYIIFFFSSILDNILKSLSGCYRSPQAIGRESLLAPHTTTTASVGHMWKAQEREKRSVCWDWIVMNTWNLFSKKNL